MQSITRAIVQHHEDRSTNPDSLTSTLSSTCTRRQVVVQEDIISHDTGDARHLRLVLHEADVRNSVYLNRLAAYVNEATISTEQRLLARLGDALSSSSVKIESAIDDRSKACASTIEERLQYSLNAAQAKLAAENEATILGHAVEIQSRVSARILEAESNQREAAFEHSIECEKRIQAALHRSQEVFDCAASVHATIQSSKVEERLQAALFRQVEDRQDIHATNFQSTLDKFQVDMKVQASMAAEHAHNDIQKRLQDKLDAALQATQVQCHEYTDMRVAAAMKTFETKVSSAQDTMEALSATWAANIESRMQQKVRDAHKTTQNAVADMDAATRRAVQYTSDACRGLESRLSAVELAVKNQAARDITARQMAEIMDMIDSKINLSITTERVTSETSSPVVNFTSDTPAGPPNATSITPEMDATDLKDLTQTTGSLPVLSDASHGPFATAASTTVGSDTLHNGHCCKLSTSVQYARTDAILQALHEIGSSISTFQACPGCSSEDHRVKTFLESRVADKETRLQRVVKKTKLNRVLSDLDLACLEATTATLLRTKERSAQLKRKAETRTRAGRE